MLNCYENIKGNEEKIEKHNKIFTVEKENISTWDFSFTVCFILLYYDYVGSISSCCVYSLSHKAMCRKFFSIYDDVTWWKFHRESCWKLLGIFQLIQYEYFWTSLVSTSTISICWKYSSFHQFTFGGRQSWCINEQRGCRFRISLFVLNGEHFHQSD